MGSNLGLVGQIGLVLLILFFFFLTFMVTKRWRALHVVCMVAVFFASLAFLFFAAFTLHTHAKWRTLVNQQTARLETELAEQEKIRDGLLTEVRQTTASLRSVRAELDRVIVDRGRVWRDTIPGAYDPATDTVVLQIPPRSAPVGPAAQVDPNDPNAPAPAPAGGAAGQHRMEERIVVYAFKEADTPDGYKVPSTYIGEFYAQQVDPTSVRLRAVVPLDARQDQIAATRDSTWVLYEVMPVDGHHWFADLDQAQLQQLGLPARSLQEYLRDGKESQPGDPPDLVWTEIRFDRAHTIDVDTQDAPTTLTTDYFDSTGLARNPWLRQGSRTEFEVGNTVIMDSASAEQLIANGVATKIRDVYVRRLRDYEYAFHNIHRRLVRLDEHTRNTQRDLADVQQAHDKAKRQVAFREQEKTRLEQDLAGFRNELAKIQALATATQQADAELKGRLSALYRANNQMERELADIQFRLADEIERRAREAVAEAQRTSTTAQ